MSPSARNGGPACVHLGQPAPMEERRRIAAGVAHPEGVAESRTGRELRRGWPHRGSMVNGHPPRSEGEGHFAFSLAPTIEGQRRSASITSARLLNSFASSLVSCRARSGGRREACSLEVFSAPLPCADGHEGSFLAPRRPVEMVDAKAVVVAESLCTAAPTPNPDGSSPAGSLDRGKGESTP